VISTGDSLDGKTVSDLFLSENSLAGGYLSFQAGFSDTGRGIYRLTISELVDAPDPPSVDPKAVEKAKLENAIERINKQLKKVRKAGQSAKVKRFTTQLRNIRKKLRQRRVHTSRLRRGRCPDS